MIKVCYISGTWTKDLYDNHKNYNLTQTISHRRYSWFLHDFPMQLAESEKD